MHKTQANVGMGAARRGSRHPHREETPGLTQDSLCFLTARIPPDFRVNFPCSQTHPHSHPARSTGITIPSLPAAYSFKAQLQQFRNSRFHPIKKDPPFRRPHSSFVESLAATQPRFSARAPRLCPPPLPIRGKGFCGTGCIRVQTGPRPAPAASRRLLTMDRQAPLPLSPNRQCGLLSELVDPRTSSPKPPSGAFPEASGKFEPEERGGA